MTHEELQQKAFEFLGKVFNGDTTVLPHSVQAAVAIVLSEPPKALKK